MNSEDSKAVTVRHTGTKWHDTIVIAEKNNLLCQENYAFITPIYSLSLSHLWARLQIS